MILKSPVWLARFLFTSFAVISFNHNAYAEQLPTESFISEGQILKLEKQGFSITPPKGWKVDTQAAGVSLVMEEATPGVEQKDETNSEIIKFKRNITVASINHASPMDEKRANELRNELVEKFSKSPMVSNYSVLEHKFFDFKSKNDGIIVYTSMQLGEFTMMQMHILVSGSDKQFLISYTDLASEFAKGAANISYDTAWKSMTSIEVSGVAPERWKEFAWYGASAGGTVFMVLLMFMWIRRRSKVSFEEEMFGSHDEDDEFSNFNENYTTMPATQVAKKTVNGRSQYAQSMQQASMHDSLLFSNF